MNKTGKNVFTATVTAVITMVIGSGSALAGGFLDLEFADTDFADPPSLIIDNSYWPLRPDESFIPRTFTYIGASDEECVIDQVSVDNIDYGSTYLMTGAAPYGGLEVVQVVDTEWVFEDVEEDDCNPDLLLADDADDAIKELTLDWYLEDNQDNIWYMGEYSQSFEDDCAAFPFNPTGVGIPPDCKEGSWEAGVDGDPDPLEMLIGQAGIVVPGDVPIEGEPLAPGTYYMQEVAYEAEDMAKILKLNASVEDAYPEEDYENCRKIKEWNPFEHGGSVEHKWYCSGPGLVLIEGIGGGPTEVETLVEIDPAL